MSEPTTGATFAALPLDEVPDVEPATPPGFVAPARVGGVVVMSDTFPGSWGWGTVEAEAVEQWRRNGGRGARLVLTIGDYWQEARVDFMGQVWADVADAANADVPRRDRPPVVTSAERVAANGRRKPLDLDGSQR